MINPRLPLLLFFLPLLGYATPAQPTLKQIQAHAVAFSAILATTNQSPLTELGTGSSKEAEQQMLASWWGVHSRDELLKLLEGIELGWNGHRAGFHQLLEHFRGVQAEDLFNTLVREAKTRDELEQGFVAATYLHAPEGKTLRFTAWDFGRYINLCRWGFTSGYLTEDEAWARILPVARFLQTAFASWQAFAEDYVQGREYYSPAQMRNNGNATRQAVTMLSMPPDGLWERIAWNESLGEGPVAVDRYAKSLGKRTSDQQP